MRGSSPNDGRCERTELVGAYALSALEPSEAQSMAAHVPTCVECREEYDALRPVSQVLTTWRNEAPPPIPTLWRRLTERIAVDAPSEVDISEVDTSAARAADCDWPEPQWEEVAAGISCKLLSTDREVDRVSMLVQLAPGVSYPAHRHASTEELYLLRGELWIDERKLQPGDYNRAEAGTADQRVWSETGCMCLLITSPLDELR